MFSLFFLFPAEPNIDVALSTGIKYQIKGIQESTKTHKTHSTNVITFAHEQIVITSYRGRVPKAPSPFL